MSGLFNEPHPYTKGLIASVPGLGKAGEKLGGIKEASPLDLPARFPSTVQHAREICRIHEPELVRVGMDGCALATCIMIGIGKSRNPIASIKGDWMQRSMLEIKILNIFP